MEITNKIILDRVQYLENKQYSTNTIGNYFTDLKLFLFYLQNRKQGITVKSEDITLIEIENRKTTLSETLTPKTSIYYTVKPTISQATIQSKLTAIKSFIKYLNYFYDEGIDYRRIETKRIKTDYIEYLTDEEFKIFQTFIWDYEKYRINALRSQLLCNIWFTSGLRLSEMLGLTVEEIKKRETRIIGKGKKARWVFFTNSTEELLEQYLEEREKPIPRTWKTESRSDYVFISHNSGYDYWKPIKKNTVCEKIKKYSDELDMWKRITVHTLRHSYATKLLESWMNIREIQELLGHCDIQTTQNYCHVLRSNLKNRVYSIFD